MDRSIGHPETGALLPFRRRRCGTISATRFGEPGTGTHSCAEVDQRNVSAIGSNCANNEYVCGDLSCVGGPTGSPCLDP
jgi:hypothetical protein